MRPLFAVLAFQVCVGGIVLVDLMLEAPGKSGAFDLVIRLLALIGLFVGAAISYVLSRLIRPHANEKSKGASQNFEAQLLSNFEIWDFTKSESEVAMLALKGHSNAEIGNHRGTSSTTVKSQFNSIYRKSGFSNRQQLVAFLFDQATQAKNVGRVGTAGTS